MLPADMPEDRTMESLGWLIHGVDVVEHGDSLLCTLPDGGTWVVCNHELSDLQDRGWIDLLTKEEHVTVTSKGTYWYYKWRREKAKEAKLPASHGPLVLKPVTYLHRPGQGGCHTRVSR